METNNNPVPGSSSQSAKPSATKKPSQNITSIAFCREKVCPDLSSLHYALLFQKPVEQAFWLGCFTLAHEIKRATLQQVEAGLTQVKLGWWQNALTQAKQNEAQHPVILAIGQEVVRSISDEHWANLINITVDSCEPKRYDTLSQWKSHLADQVGPWIQIVQQRFKCNDAKTLADFWIHSLQITQLLRLAKYLDQNFQPIPMELLASHETSIDLLRSRQVEENQVKLFDYLIKQIKQDADSQWKTINRELKLHARPLRALYLMKCAEAEQHIKDRYAQLLQEQKALSPGRRFWISWKTHVLRA